MRACGRLLLAGLLVLLDQQLSCAGFNYEDVIFEDLYKRLADLEDRGYMTAAGGPDANEVDAAYLGEPGDWTDSLDMNYDPSDVGMADPRDQEFLEHPSNADGFQHISGGAGEGSQHLTPEGTQNNTQEVKSDEALPFYCHPPNPCPKGQKDEDGCQSNIEDTAEFQKQWIDRLMKHKLCTCDEEHMFACPRMAGTVSAQKSQKGRDKLDDVLDVLFGQEEDKNNPYVNGIKNEALVAKKSPGMFYMEPSRDNPYLSGEKIRTVAKKG